MVRNDVLERFVATAQPQGSKRRLPFVSIRSRHWRARIFSALGDTAGMWPMLEDSLAGRGGALQNLVSEVEFERYRDEAGWLPGLKPGPA